MGITIQITGTTGLEIIAQMRSLLSGASGLDAAIARKAEAKAEAPTVEVEKPKPLEGEVSVPAKRGRKPKAETGTVTDINTEGDPVEKQTDLEDAIAVEDVRAALKALMEQCGENATWGLLSKHGVKNATTAFEAGKGGKIVAEAKALIAAKQK